MDGIGIVDGEGNHVGVVTLLERDPSGGEDLFGWTVSLPGNVARNATRRTRGRDAAVAAALAAAGEIGVVGARANREG